MSILTDSSVAHNMVNMCTRLWPPSTLIVNIVQLSTFDCFQAFLNFPLLIYVVSAAVNCQFLANLTRFHTPRRAKSDKNLYSSLVHSVSGASVCCY
jgi:hypothetical protein